MVDREPTFGPPSNPIEIVSEKTGISLRQLTPDDVQVAFDLIDRNREHLSHYGDVTSANYRTYDQILNSIVLPRNPFRLRFGVRNSKGIYVGSINVTPSVENRDVGEIGYYIGSEFQGYGYTTKAVEMLSDYAFENLGYQELFGSVVDGNIGSVRVLQNAGYSERERLIINETVLIQLYKTKPSNFMLQIT